MSTEIDLPDGWRVTKLADFVNAKKGKKPKFVSKEKTEKFNIPYVNIKAFEQNIIDEYTNGEGCVFCEDNDFLMVWDGSRSGYVGRAIKGAIGSTLVKLSFPKEVFEKFAYYYLQSKYIEINTRAKGVGIPHVDPNLVWNYQFLLPPVAEQIHIVEKLEELFSELDKAIENLKIAQRQLKVYRQAVLKWAFEGKLTNEDVKDGELQEGWELNELGNVVDRVFDGPFGSNLKSDDYVDAGVRVIRLENIGVLEFKDEYQTYVSNEKYSSLKKHTVSAGDIIFSSFIIENVRVVILPSYIKCAINKADCFCIRVGDNEIDKNFLAYFLSTKNVYNQLINEVHGATRPRINTKQLKSCVIPICPLNEQKQIVQEIESRLSVCDKIEETITNSLQQAEALRQSILKRAFEGKLVKAEGNKVVNLNELITTEEEKDWQRKVLAGKIIEICHDDNNFGHTKFQKTQQLCEYHAQLEFDTRYIKQVAGPFDKDFFFPLIEEAKINNWFYEKPKRKVTFFEPGSNIASLTDNYYGYFKDKDDKIQFVLNLLRDKDTFQCELISTIYAIWNNYLIKREDISSDQLIAEVYDWSESKVKFSAGDIIEMWEWMKSVDLVPSGFGKLINK